MNSDYCYSIEMKRALERYDRGEAIVIPIILRHIYWQGEPLGKLQALPKDSIPITDPSWSNVDVALYRVTEGILKVVDKLAIPRGNKSFAVIPNGDEISFPNDGDVSMSLAVFPAAVVPEFTPVHEYPETISTTQNECKTSSLTLQQVKDAWENVKKRVKVRDREAGSKKAAMLNDFSIVGVEGTAEEAIVIIQAAHELHHNYIHENERYKDVEWALSMAFRQKCSVRLLLPGESIVPSLTLQQVKDAWEIVRKRVKVRDREAGPKKAAMLNGFSIVGIEGTAEEAIIVIQATYELYHKYMQEGERSKDVEWALSMEFKQKCRVRLLAPGQPYFAEKTIF